MLYCESSVLYIPSLTLQDIKGIVKKDGVNRDSRSTAMTPHNRARDAQVEFARQFAPVNPDREKLREALLSVITTARAARDNHGQPPMHGHKNIAEEEPERWARIEHDIYKMAKGGGRLKPVMKILEFAFKNEGLVFYSAEELLEAARELEAA
ncbi:hypothetical protein C4585_00865 [Candidatus Parcubacteria bacterium]|nr:MAG: hypothetical protein C4585_00865 [Candidatus Parcubacteria bacterium]